MPTFHVKTLYCGGCRVFKRCRIEDAGNGLFVYPACADCGAVAWSETEPPAISEPYDREVTEGVIADFMPGIAPFADLQQFFSELGQQQAAYLRRVFDQWQEQRNDAEQSVRDEVESDRARMWRQVWSVLEDAE